MELKFIGQGLNEENNTTTGNYIIESLENTQYTNFKAFVAFISKGGINNIVTPLTSFKSRGGGIVLYVGVDLNGTSKEALEKLIELEIESYIIFSPNNIIYHPKIYTFEGETLSRAIVGSSNFTERGLFQSIEASVCIDFNNQNDDVAIEFLSEIYTHFNSIINNQHPSCQRLTVEVLDILVNSKIVLPEAVSRSKFNKNNREYSEKDSTAYDGLLRKFAKLKPNKPPRGFKKIVTKEDIIIKEDNEISIVNEEVELLIGSMWIETGMMTGGSKNQLDMSKKGKIDGTTINGSVSYFGLDPEETTLRKNIDIHLGSKIYKNNPILYTPGNDNWRIQLKGVTDSGERLTSISRMQLGQEGGFVKKILLFTRIDETNYMMEILDLEEKEKLIENSSLWAKMGNETTGRAYGFI